MFTELNSSRVFGSLQPDDPVKLQVQPRQKAVAEDEARQFGRFHFAAARGEVDDTGYVPVFGHELAGEVKILLIGDDELEFVCRGEVRQVRGQEGPGLAARGGLHVYDFSHPPGNRFE